MVASGGDGVFFPLA
uniref:Uncharacterized protein n=1 Tax=Vitis vinifera TaxID=29760 RepID=F6I759_VITVI